MKKKTKTFALRSSSTATALEMTKMREYVVCRGPKLIFLKFLHKEIADTKINTWKVTKKRFRI